MQAILYVESTSHSVEIMLSQTARLSGVSIEPFPHWHQKPIDGLGARQKGGEGEKISPRTQTPWGLNYVNLPLKGGSGGCIGFGTATFVLAGVLAASPSQHRLSSTALAAPP
jgi:hypothetical protein